MSENYTENKMSPEYKEQLRKRGESLREFLASGAMAELQSQVQEDMLVAHRRLQCGATKQVTALANFIMAEIPGEPSRSEGATDCAIRVMREQKAEVARLKAELATQKNDLHEAVMATHRQADCINRCAAEIGPDTSATIDGLPLAVRRLKLDREAHEALEKVARDLGFANIASALGSLELKEEEAGR